MIHKIFIVSFPVISRVGDDFKSIGVIDWKFLPIIINNYYTALKTFKTI